jgi:ABC-type uncharacterized transport system ATPase subunit
MPPGYQPIFGVLWDMIGDADLRVLQEGHSVERAPEVVNRVWDTVQKVEGPRQWLTFPHDASAAPLVAAVVAAYDVADLSILEPAIEDVIARIYSRR